MERYNGGRVIAKDERIILTYPQNSWDTNYHAYDKDNGNEYLIDINDIADNEEEYQNGGIMLETFKELNIDEIEEYAWKILNDGIDITEKINVDR